MITSLRCSQKLVLQRCSQWRCVGSKRLLQLRSSSSNTSSAAALYMWGTDTQGSLLKPPERQDEKLLDVPSKIDFPYGSIQRVTCGPTDTAWILADGRCLVSGENKQGQLGVGNQQPVKSPTEIKLPVEKEGTGVKQVALGSNFSAFVDTAGDLYTVGFGGSTLTGFGALGHGDDVSYYTPKLVESMVEDGVLVQQVQVGESHMTVLTTEGEVLCCGAGSYGRLGNFDTADQLFLEPVELLTSGVVEIAGGKSFTLALEKDGTLYGWGRNHKGQLGTGLGLAVDMYAMQAVPEPIEADELLGRKVVKVTAGSGHAACITESGELFYWGMSLHLEPVRVNDLLHTKVVDVACGQDYTLALDQDGMLYSWGTGKTGVLGQGSVRKLNQATVMEVFQGKKVQQMSAGYKHAACLVDES